MHSSWQWTGVLHMAAQWQSRQCYWENYFIKTHRKSLQMRYRELWSAFFHPYFLTDTLCRPSWVVEGEGQPSCQHTVFSGVTGLPFYQIPAYLLNQSLLDIKIFTECKNWCIAGSSTEQVTNNPFSSKTNCLPLPTSKTSNTFQVFILALSVQGS